MPRGFTYGLQFVVKADVQPAIRAIHALSGELEKLTGQKVDTRALRQAQSLAAAMGAETDATERSTKATKDKATAHGELMAVWAKSLKIFWTLVGAFYLLRNVVRLVTDLYRKLIDIALRAGAVLGKLAGEVLKNSAAFEELRTRIEAVSPTAEMGRRTFERLKDFVIGMPFTLREAADAFVYLEATGVRANMGLMRSMHVAATMAKTMDRSIKDAALAIAKLQAGNMQRLTRGFAISGQQLLPFGAVAGRVPGALEHKAPGAAQANVEALYRFVEARWGTLLQRMANTWSQLVNDMTDIWEQLMSAIGEKGILMALKEVLAYVREIRGYFKDTGVMDRWAQSIADAWRPVIEQVGPWLENLPGIMETIVGWTAKLGDRATAWLDSMGGITGMWERIVAGFKENGPAILELLNAYAQAMIAIGRAITQAAATNLMTHPGTWALVGGRRRAWRMAAGLQAADVAQGKVADMLNELTAQAPAWAAGINFGRGPGGFPTWAGRQSIAPGDVAGATTKALANAVKEGSAEGTQTGVEAAFGKGAVAKAKDVFNPYVEMWRLMEGGLPLPQGRSPLAPLATRMANAPRVPGEQGIYSRQHMGAMLAEMNARYGNVPGNYQRLQRMLADQVVGQGPLAGGAGSFRGRAGLPERNINIQTFLNGRPLTETVRGVSAAEWGGVSANQLAY